MKLWWDVEEIPLYAGQNAGLADEQLSAGELVERLARETADTIKSTGSLLQDDSS